MIAGCVFGYLLAICCSQFLMGHMNRTFGKQTMGIQIFVIGIFIAGIMYVIVLLFTRKILGKIKKSSITDLLVLEHGFGKEYQVKSSIHKSRKLPINLLIGCSEVRRGYGIIIVLLFFATVLIEIPGQVTATMKDDKFVTNMGSPLTDVMIEVEQGSDVEKRETYVNELMQNEIDNGKIADYDVIRTVRIQAADIDGELQGVHVDTGNTSGEGLSYLTGSAPKKENEIALSVLNSEELGKQAGDMISVKAGEETFEFMVTGTYQDVTSGGKTAKTPYDFGTMTAEKYTVLVDLRDKEEIGAQIVSWQEQLGKGYVVEDMKMFLGQTIGGVTSQLENIQWILFLLGIIVTAVITALYLKLRIIREAEQFAVKKAIGIPERAVITQELSPIILAGITGIVAGFIFTGTLGEGIISIAFGVMGTGLSKIEFIGMPLSQSVGIPILLCGVLIVVTLFTCRGMRKMSGKDFL